MGVKEAALGNSDHVARRPFLMIPSRVGWRWTLPVSRWNGHAFSVVPGSA